jgi:hypothetical protein
MQSPSSLQSPQSAQPRPASAAASASIAAQEAAGRDRRVEPRFAYHTVATMVTEIEAPDTAEPLKCWTRDLSPSGARIMSLVPIEAMCVRLKLLLPRIGSQVIEARIVSRSSDQQIDIHNNRTTLFLYGVIFTRVLASGG